jgi:dTDP-4-dehydrorhamnose reductase
MKIGIIGGNGMLGTELMKAFPGAVDIAHKRCPIEISALDLPWFDLVINTAAFHDVAECEKHPNRAFEVNYVGARNLAKLCAYRGMRLIHISTNMVFNGHKWLAYGPTDHCDPLNVYGYSKWLGECAIRDEMERGLQAMIVRLGPIYGHAPCRGKNGRQFVTDLLNKKGPLAYPIDQRVNPISCADAARAIVDLSSTGGLPIAHVGSNNECSWYEFARHILHQKNDPRPIEPVLTRDKRPLNGVLRPSLVTPTWQESLTGYFSSRPESA